MNNDQNIKKELERLRREVAYHAKKYYVDDAPEISDYDYDMLYRRLEELEAAHPEFCQWVLDKKIKGQGNHVWWKIAPGKHRLALRCGAETDTIRFEVLQ